MMSRVPLFVRDALKRFLRRQGLDLVRYSPDPLARVVALLGRRHVDVVLDVGANEGQYFHGLRRAGYGGRVISFEPNPEAFARLRAQASQDPAWTGHAVALGRTDGTAMLNVAAHSVFSSLRTPRAGASAIDGGLALVRQDTVSVRTLASMWHPLALDRATPFLKLDVQGFEPEVLAGAGQYLDACAGIQLELPFEPLYEGQAVLGEVVAGLVGRGYAVFGIFEGARDQATGALLEADVVLLNRRRPPTDRDVSAPR